VDTPYFCRHFKEMSEMLPCISLTSIDEQVTRSVLIVLSPGR
jgi:hypothetical protein